MVKRFAAIVAGLLGMASVAWGNVAVAPAGRYIINRSTWSAEQFNVGRSTASQLAVSSIPSGECVQTTTGGLLTGTGAACGSGGGGGASTLAVATGTISGFTTPASSPTAVINANSTQFRVTKTGGATAYFEVNPSTFTMLGPVINLDTNEVTGRLPEVNMVSTAAFTTKNQSWTAPQTFTVALSSLTLPIVKVSSMVVWADGSISTTAVSGGGSVSSSGGGIVSPGTFTWVNDGHGLHISTMIATGNVTIIHSVNDGEPSLVVNKYGGAMQMTIPSDGLGHILIGNDVYMSQYDDLNYVNYGLFVSTLAIKTNYGIENFDGKTIFRVGQSGSVAIGEDAAFGGGSGTGISIGENAGEAKDGTISIGLNAGGNTKSINTINIGSAAGSLSNEGSINIGHSFAGQAAGNNSINIGASSPGRYASTGTINIGVFTSAESAASTARSTGSINIGEYAGYKGGGKYGIAIGHKALENNSFRWTGSYFDAAYGIGIGMNACDTSLSGTDIVCIGRGSDVSTANEPDNQIAIGRNAIAPGNNTMKLGGELSDSVRVYASSATIGELTVRNLPSGQCVQTGTGGLLEVTGSACGSGGGYATVQDEGSGLTQRATLNFAGAGVTCADDTTRTTCTIPGGGVGGGDNLGSHISTQTLIARYSIEASSVNFSSNTILPGATFYHNARAVVSSMTVRGNLLVGPQTDLPGIAQSFADVSYNVLVSSSIAIENNGTIGTLALTVSTQTVGGGYNNFALGAVSLWTGTESATEKFHVGIGAEASSQGTGTLLGLYGVDASAIMYSGSGDVAVGAGVHVHNWNLDNSLFSQVFGVYIQNALNSGGGIIGEQYGFYTEPLTTGLTNWAVYTAGDTPSKFGGRVTMAEALVSSNTVLSGTTFYHNAPAVFGTAPKLASLTSQSCIGTGADGTIQAGTCGGGSVLAYSTRTITFAHSGGGSAITAGTTTFLYVPYTGTIKDWTIVSTSTGSAVIDVKKCAGFNCNPTDSIAASAKPTLSSAWANQDTTLTGWTTSVAAGDKMAFVINSASTITDVQVVLKVWVTQIP